MFYQTYNDDNPWWHGVETNEFLRWARHVLASLAGDTYIYIYV